MTSGFGKITASDYIEEMKTFQDTLINFEQDVEKFWEEERQREERGEVEGFW